MYCSKDCMALDEDKFHQFDCVEDSEDENPARDTSLQMLCQILHHFNWNVDEMKKLLDDHKEANTVFDFDMSDPKEYHKNLLLATMCLKIRSKKLPGKVTNPIKLCQQIYISRHPELSSILKNPKHEGFLSGLITKLMYIGNHLRTINLYTNIDMNYNEKSKPNQEGEVITNTILRCNDPYRLLTKHSCIANVHVQYYNGKSAWVVTVPVPAGGPITIGMLPVALKWDEKKKRQEFLLDQFGFKCDCDACKFDWKFFVGSKMTWQLQNAEKFMRAILYSPLSALQSQVQFSKSDHMKLAREAFESIPELYQKVPSKEFWIYQVVLMKAVNFLAFPQLFEK